MIEVAEEILEKRRIEGLEFDMAVVTDLGPLPSLEFESLLARRRAKARLVRKVVPGGTTVVNANDPHAELLGAVNLDARRVSFGIDHPADVTARIVRLDTRGSRFLLHGFDREAIVELHLVGSAHVSQALAAAAVAWSRGLALDAVIAGLESVRSVPGRLEAVVEGQDFEVWIDQARSGAELQQALTSLRAITAGKIHCVIGAEGLREALGPAGARPGRRGRRRPRHLDHR